MVRLSLVLIGLSFPALLHAQAIPPPCPISFLPCATGGAAGVANYGINVVFPALRWTFVAILLGMFLFYALRLLFASHAESTVTETKEAYEHALFGAGIVSLASLVVQSFGPNEVTTAVLVNPVPVTYGLNNIIILFKIALATVVFLRITVQAVRLILLQGQSEGELEKARSRFLNGLLGVAVILLANTAVTAVSPDFGAQSAIIADEARGIANFLMEFLGAGTVLTFIGAGIATLVGVNEGLRNRARKAMFGAVVAMIVTMSAYVIVNFFLFL